MDEQTGSSETYYKLTQQESQILAFADSDDIDPSALQDTLDAIHQAKDQKLLGYVHVAEEAKMKAEAYQKKVKERQQYIQHLRKLSKRLSDFVIQEMQARGLKTLEDDDTLVRVQGNGGVKAIHLDKTKLQADCWKEVEEPDMDLIRKRLEANEPVLGAELVDRGSHLVVK